MIDRRDSDPIVVLYIGGEGRSGSTLLATLLGNHDGFLPVGEFRDIWQVLKTDERCGCGEVFSKCEFWRRVGERSFGGWGRIDVEAMLDMDSRFARQRRVPRLLLSLVRCIESADLLEYRRQLARLYAAVAEVSGCSVIVDSTKDPAYYLLLRGVPGIELRVVHLVRDSRGVAYSWNKKHVERPEYSKHPVLKDTFMDSRSAWIGALEWDAKNVLLHCLALSTRHLLLRYESLMSAPAQELTRILRLAEEGRVASAEATRACREFEYLPFHTLGGNRVRFQRGQIELHIDDAWKNGMPSSERLVVSTLTLPLLIAYRYLGGLARLGHGRKKLPKDYFGTRD